MSKFVKKMLTPDIRNNFVKEIERISQMNEKDKVKFVGQIKVVVCNEKCPCCGRICGIENDHPHHKCLYGHQMQGLNGAYI